MEFGIFHEFPSLSGGSDADSFAAAFDVVDGAEKWGLDAIWLAELHFDPARSVLSSPMCVASAIAARTERMKIGVAVQVLPLCNPLRIAEEAATVDQISQGRLIFGAGRSGVAATYDAYNIPYSESKERFAETLEIVRRAWTARGEWVWIFMPSLTGKAQLGASPRCPSTSTTHIRQAPNPGSFGS